MRVEELLTYIEELEFKTSVRGYNKDEVDIQLDKICDEIEGLIKEKNEEIASLKAALDAKPAPLPVPTPIVKDASDDQAVIPMAQYQELQAYADSMRSQLEESLAGAEQLRAQVSEEAQENRKLSETLYSVIAELDEQKGFVVKARTELSQTRKELNAFKKSVEGNPLEAALEETKTLLEEARQNADQLSAALTEEKKEKESITAEAEAYRKDAEDKVSALEGQVSQLQAQLEDALDVDKAAMIPGNVNGAYNLYLKKADVLSSLLVDMEEKRDNLIKTAQEEADKTVSVAKEEAERMVETAASQAKQITADADEYAQVTAEVADNDAQKLISEAKNTALTTVTTAKNTAEETLLTARTEAEETLSAAKAEAEQIILAAREESVQITKDSFTRAEEAEQRCVELAERKSSLLTELQSMNKQVFDLLSKLQ